jgi:hypothetical protein
LAAYRVAELALKTLGVNLAQHTNAKLLACVLQDLEKYQQQLDRAIGIASGTLDTQTGQIVRNLPHRVFALVNHADPLTVRVCQAGLDMLTILLDTSACLLSSSSRLQIDAILLKQALGAASPLAFMANGAQASSVACYTAEGLSKVSANVIRCLMASLATPYTGQADVAPCIVELIMQRQHDAHIQVSTS